MEGHKVTLSSGKVVLLHEQKIKHTSLAIRAVGNRATGNSLLQQTMITEEMVKILLYSVDGKVPTPEEKEDLDSLFTTQEYTQVLTFINGGKGDLEIPKFETTQI